MAQILALFNLGINCSHIGLHEISKIVRDLQWSQIETEHFIQLLLRDFNTCIRQTSITPPTISHLNRDWYLWKLKDSKGVPNVWFQGYVMAMCNFLPTRKKLLKQPLKLDNPTRTIRNTEPFHIIFHPFFFFSKWTRQNNKSVPHKLRNIKPTTTDKTFLPIIITFLI